jgi:diadenosine tetraphosphate (Ap4A) HIT family hydrolase
MDQINCPFCNLEKSRILIENEYAIGFFDGYPISPGHALVIPKKHVASFFELPESCCFEILKVVSLLRSMLVKDFGTSDFNIGLNDGKLAGQTVMHSHIHIIPRNSGDVADPRGGLRWVIPAKAEYWLDDLK